MISQLHYNILHLFSQLETVVGKLPDEKFREPIALLGGSSVGQHLRHIIECYQELVNGYENGTVNYDGRKRDLLLESCQATALQALQTIKTAILLENKSLILLCEQHSHEAGQLRISTNFDRELLYNLEHTVHHMA